MAILRECVIASDEPAVDVKLQKVECFKKWI
jgi:hypothetical protein